MFDILSCHVTSSPNKLIKKISFVVVSVLLQDYISFSIFVSLLDKGRSMLKKDDLIGNILDVVAFGILLT